MNNARHLTALIALALIIFTGASASATEGVSPGAVDRMAQVNNACPTFSWGIDSGAVAYDLIAYVLPEDAARTAELTADNEVLFTRVAGSATSWTPSADQCFAPGGRYVWFVRAVSEFSGDQVIEASEWSAGRYFTVPAAPSAEEMQRALDVLRRLDAANGDGSLMLSSAPTSASAPAAAPVSGTGTGSAAPKSIPTAPAAIRGHHPLLNGIAYGVVGTTTAAGGAGVAAAHLEGGADLVLDGSVDGQADTKIYEWGLERLSADDETFRFRTTGGGAMIVDVDGTITATGLHCPGCVTSADFASGAVDSNALHDSAVTTPKIANDAVTSVKIQDGQIREVDLGPNAVTSDKIEDGAVTLTKIDDGAVSKEKLRDNAVVSSKILDGSIAGVDLAIGAVGSTQILNQSVTGNDLANGAVATRHIEDGTITEADVSPTSAIYVSKSQLYIREETSTQAWSNNETPYLEAFCDDANDLPLSGECYGDVNNYMILKATSASNWNDPSQPAGWRCDFFSQVEHLSPVTIYSRILCISVP